MLNTAIKTIVRMRFFADSGAQQNNVGFFFVFVKKPLGLGELDPFFFISWCELWKLTKAVTRVARRGRAASRSRQAVA